MDKIKIVAENRKARFDYSIIDTYEAGIQLMGTEVKSLRNGSCQLKDGFCEFQNDELYMLKVHIAEYKQGAYANHSLERRRKLLLHRQEIDQLLGKVKERGLTIIPLKVYFKEGFAKVEIALVKGKKAFDKRETIKERDVNRDLEQRRRK
jgi:SsrA-binding protein